MGRFGAVTYKFYAPGNLSTPLNVSGVTTKVPVDAVAEEYLSGEGGGSATFVNDTALNTLAAVGNICYATYTDAVRDDLPGGMVFSESFIIRSRRTVPGTDLIVVEGPDLLTALRQYTIYRPLGLETIVNTTLTAAVRAPFDTTLMVGAPRNNKSMSPTDSDEDDPGREVRNLLNNGNIQVNLILGRVYFDGRWRYEINDRFQDNADAGNYMQVRDRRIHVAAPASFAEGTEVHLTTVGGTFITLVDEAPDGDIVTVRDGVPYAANNGATIISKDYSQRSTNDVSMVMGYASGWGVEFETGTGTAMGTRYGGGGDTVYDILRTISDETGEYFRIKSAEASPAGPKRTVRWNRSYIGAGVGVSGIVRLVEPTQAAMASETAAKNRAIMLSRPEHEGQYDPVTQVIPVPSDPRISLFSCSSSALAAATSQGFSVVTTGLGLYAPPYVQNDSLQASVGTSQRRVSFSEVTVEGDNANSLIEAADKLLRLSIDFLKAHVTTAKNIRVRCVSPIGIRPGDLVEMYYVPPTGEYTLDYTGANALYVLEAKRSVSADGDLPGAVITELLLGPSPQAPATGGGEVGRRLKAVERAMVQIGTPRPALTSVSVGTGGGTIPTTPPNTGTVSTIDPVYNVLTYGADKSGVADSTAAIQSAVDHALTAGGGTVFFPAGTYLMNSGGVTLGNKVTLEGAGRLETVVKRTNSQTTSMFAYEPTSASMSGVTIQDMTISSSSAETHCVRLGVDDGYEIQNTMLRNVLISNPYDAQYARCLLINGMTRNVDVDNCIFIGCETPTTNQSRNWQYTVMVGVGPNQCGPGHTIVFRDCLFKYGQIGLNVTATSNTPTAGRTQALTIDNCEWEGQTVIGLRLYHGQGYRITNCNFHNIKTYPTAAQLADTEYGTNWPVEPAAAWLDMIHADGGADQYRGAVAVISDNLFRNIEGTALYVEDASNHVISGNSISFVTKRTGAQASIASIDPTGFTSVGGVGLFIGKGKQRPMIVGNSIHYCEHAGIRASIGFGPPTFTDESDYYWFIGNRIHKCGDYGIRMDGHFNTTINISNNQIEGDPAGIWTSGSNTAGIFFTKSAAQSSTGLGIARFICMGNMITGSTYGVYKDYEMAAGSTGQALQMVGNTINCTGTYAVYWRGANGNVTSNNFHGKSTSFTKAAGGYNPTFIMTGNGDGDVSTENDNQWLQATTFKTTTGALTLKTDSGALQLQSTGGAIALAPTGGNVTVSQDVIVAGGLGVGHASAEPDAGEIWLYNGGQGKLRRTGANVEWWNGSAWQDLTLAAEASSNPGASSLVLKTDASGLLQVAGLGVNHTPGISQFTVGGMIKTTSALLSGVDMTYSGGPGQLILDRATNAGVAILLDSDAGHGITGPMASTDTFLQVSESNTTGGVNIEGANSAGQGILLTGYAGTSSTSRTATAPVTVYGYKVTSSVQDADADQNVFAIRTQRSGVNRTVFVVDEDGDIHVDGSSTVNTFDDYDDTALVRAADLALAGHDIDSEFGRLVRYNRADLEAAKIISIEDDGTIYLNTTRMQRLLSGAVWQLAERVKALEARLT